MLQTDLSDQVKEAYVVFLKSLIKIKNHINCDPILTNVISSLEDAAQDYSDDVAGTAKKLDERSGVVVEAEYEKLTGHEYGSNPGRV